MNGEVEQQWTRTHYEVSKGGCNMYDIRIRGQTSGDDARGGAYVSRVWWVLSTLDRVKGRWNGDNVEIVPGCFSNPPLGGYPVIDGWTQECIKNAEFWDMEKG